MMKNIFLVAISLVIILASVIWFNFTPNLGGVNDADRVSTLTVDTTTTELLPRTENSSNYTFFDFSFTVPDGKVIERREQLGDGSKCQSRNSPESCKTILLTTDDNSFSAAIKGVDFTVPMGCNFTCYSTQPSFGEVKDEDGVVRREAKTCPMLSGLITATEIKNSFTNGNEDGCYSFTNTQGLDVIVTYETLYDQPRNLLYHFENPNQNFGYFVVLDILTSSQNSESIFSIVQSVSLI